MNERDKARIVNLEWNLKEYESKLTRMGDAIEGLSHAKDSYFGDKIFNMNKELQELSAKFDALLEHLNLQAHKYPAKDAEWVIEE
jgi:hypothetical protein